MVGVAGRGSPVPRIHSGPVRGGGAYLVADPESFELVEPGEGPFHDPAGLAQAGSVWGAASGDLRCGSPSPEFGYDTQSRVTSMQRVAPTGTDTWTYAYSATTRAPAGTTTVTDPNAHKTVYTVDGSGQVTKVVDALNHTRSSSYDANHNQKTAVNAPGSGSENTTTFGWDGSDNLNSAKLPTGATTALGAHSTHSGANLPSSLTNPSGKKTSYSYDTSGNLTSSQDTTTGVSDGSSSTRLPSPSTPKRATPTPDNASKTSPTPCASPPAPETSTPP